MARPRSSEHVDRPRWVKGAAVVTLLMSPLLFMLMAFTSVCHAFTSSASAPSFAHQSLSPSVPTEFAATRPGGEVPLDEHCIENCDFAGANALLPSGRLPGPAPVLAIASTFRVYIRLTLNVQSNTIPASLPPLSFHQRTSRLLN